MLYSIETGKDIVRIPYQKEFNLFRSRLSDEEYQDIIDLLNSMIDGDEIHTSSWMPGHDWTDTVFQPIYVKACNCDYDLSAKFFGLIVWTVFMDRPERWSSGRYKKGEIPIHGRTYFRIYK